MTQSEQRPTTAPAPPFVSWGTFLNQIDRMSKEGVPSKIDKYFLTGMAGGTQNHLKHAFRSLGFIDGEDRRQDSLVRFAADVAGRPQMMAAILRERFPALLALGTDAPKSDILAVLDDLGLKNADSQRKALTFYLSACEFAGIEVSPHIKSGRAPTPNGTARKTTRRKKTATTKTTTQETPVTPASGVQHPAAAHTKSVDLASGGQVILSYDVDLFDLSSEDREFVLGLVDALRDYKPKVKAAAKKKISAVPDIEPGATPDAAEDEAAES